jgi:hypothetical protein
MHAHLVAQGGVALLLRGTEGEAFANPAAGRASKPSPTAGLGRLSRRRGGAPLDGLPDQPEVRQRRPDPAMLAGSLPVPQPILDQVAPAQLA